MSTGSQQRFYSKGVESFLAYLEPDGRPTGGVVFPRGYNSARGRIGDEHAEEWFCRIVREQLAGNTGPCEIESNLAAFGDVEWDNSSGTRVLTYACLQVLTVGNTSLSRLVADGPTGDHAAHYFRLDYDLGALGSPFTHPMPHIHCRSGEVPRFALEWSPSGSIIVDFLDFIYRNYDHATWSSWADAVWVDQLRETEVHQMLEQFDVISAAFKTNRYHDIITLHSDVVRKMKAAWRSSRHTMYELKPDATILDAFCYSR
jgi:hypothetical protein